MGLKRLMKTLMMGSSYNKIDRTESMRLEMKHRKTQKLIAKTLKNVDARRTYKGFLSFFVLELQLDF
ncbi:hypothetical protein ACOSQ4_017951 [Xanthoceras sorbifolium]